MLALTCIDHVRIRLHICLECVHYQIFDPGTVSQNLWHLMASILLCGPHDWLSHREPCRASPLYFAYIILLESVECRIERCCTGR